MIIVVSLSFLVGILSGIFLCHFKMLGMKRGEGWRESEKPIAERDGQKILPESRPAHVSKVSIRTTRFSR
jgi:hypothetical protein